MSTDGVLRPLGIGEMLDASIKIYLARWKPMVVATALLTVPAMVLLALVQASTGDPESLTKTDPVTNLPTIDAGAVWVMVAALVVTLVITLVANNLATAGVLRIVSGVYLGQEIGWRESVAFAFRRFWSLTWVMVLTTLGFFLGAVACFVPALWFQGIWAVVLPVVLVENLTGRRALGRSYRLVKGRFWPVLGTMLLGGLLAVTVQFVLASPTAILLFVDTNFLVKVIVQGLGNIVGTAITTPFVAVLTMVVYFDLRVRKEGYDLYLLAQRIGVAPPAAGFPDQPGVRPPPPWAVPVAAPEERVWGPPGT